jgi:hypothetical protein
MPRGKLEFWEVCVAESVHSILVRLTCMSDGQYGFTKKAISSQVPGIGISGYEKRKIMALELS